MSAKQIAARERNWEIYQLRSLWALAGRLTQDRRAQVRKIIDEELHELGAEPEQDRENRRRAEWAE